MTETYYDKIQKINAQQETLEKEKEKLYTLYYKNEFSKRLFDQIIKQFKEVQDVVYMMDYTTFVEHTNDATCALKVDEISIYDRNEQPCTLNETNISDLCDAIQNFLETNDLENIAVYAEELINPYMTEKTK